MVLIKMVHIEGVLGTDVTLQGDGAALAEQGGDA